MLVRIGVGTATMETAWGFLRKLKMELPYDPAVPLLGIYPKTMKTLIRKIYMNPLFTAALFTGSKEESY